MLMLITANNEKDLVFSDFCKVEDYYCKLESSVIIWDKDIIHKCPVRRILTNKKFYIVKNGFMAEDLYFIFKNLVNVCGTTLILTIEGVLLLIKDNKNEDFFEKLKKQSHELYLKNSHLNYI